MPETCFDKWNSPAELINFALRNLPPMYAVPGQHDLPYHRYDDRGKSAYWTLVLNEKLTSLVPGQPLILKEGTGKGVIRLHGFPWGFPVEPLKDPGGLVLEVAVVHDLIWTSKTGFKDAPEDKRLKECSKRLGGYHVAVFGDNHKGFLQCQHPSAAIDYPMAVLNCGGFMRRKSDERECPCYVGLLWTDGSVTRVELDCSEDKWIDKKDAPITERGEGMVEFLEELGELSDAAINFGDAVRRRIDQGDSSQSVRQIVLEAMKGKGS